MGSDIFGRENGGAGCIWTAEWALFQLDVIMASTVCFIKETEDKILWVFKLVIL